VATIVFFAHDTPENLERFEYYKQDVDALRTLGHRVVLCTRYIDIPLVFDAMFIWWWTRALLPVLLCRLLGRPCVVTGTFNFRFPDHFDGTDYFRRPAWQRFLLRTAAKHCSLNLFVSQLELSQCTTHFRLDNAGYFPHCLDDDYLQGPASTRRNALFNLTWSGKGNLVRKGIPELLRAVRILKDRGVAVSVALAGLEGDGLAGLRESIHRLGIEAEVTHLGALTRDEKIRLLREHEIYVQPSHFEGFGLAILEAMGSGACVLVCDVGAVNEVVGDCGFYVTRNSPEALADAIERAMRDGDLRRRLQQLAVNRAGELFTFDRKIERLRNFLNEVGVV
jgi:glycosyltransferase involved in cell wall biosynthesis